MPFAVGDLVDLVDGTGIRPDAWHPDYPTADTLDAARMLLLAYEVSGGPTPVEEPVWWLWTIVVGGQVVGDAGFHGPPAVDGPREVEIGYQVVSAMRRRGIATRACALLLAYAWEHGADVVRADAEPENLASRAVLRANGFRLTPAGHFAVVGGRAMAWTA